MLTPSGPMNEMELWRWRSEGIPKAEKFCTARPTSVKQKDCGSSIGMKQILPWTIQFCCTRHRKQEYTEIKLRDTPYEYFREFGKFPDTSQFVIDKITERSSD